MHKRQTKRRRLKPGGNLQLQHAISQLKRFTLRAKEGQPFKELQFGYNLGRLQEMMDSQVSGAQKYWWSPVEELVSAKNWDGLLDIIEKFRIERVRVDYDESTVNKP